MQIEKVFRSTQAYAGSSWGVETMNSHIFFLTVAPDWTVKISQKGMNKKEETNRLWVRPSFAKICGALTSSSIVWGFGSGGEWWTNLCRMERSCKLTLSKTGVENKRRNKVSDEWFLEQEEKRKVLAAVLTVFMLEKLGVLRKRLPIVMQYAS